MRWTVVLACLFLAACAKPLDVAGLRPLAPTTDERAPILESSQPSLRWEPFPRPADLAADPDGWVSRVRNVSYELRIWRGERDPLGYGYEEIYPADLVYSRSGLPTPAHTVETPLASETQHLWSVRARFELDGQIRVTPWGVLLLPGQSILSDPRSVRLPPRAYYRFVTPKEPDGRQDSRIGGGGD